MNISVKQYNFRMIASQLDSQLESETITLNRWLYAESVGLEVDEGGYTSHTEALASLYAQLLERSDGVSERYFAVESWVESRRVPLDFRVSAEMDRCLQAPAFHSSEGPLTWRNWKAFERETNDPIRLAEGFEHMVQLSAALTPALEERLAQTRADYVTASGLTPVHTYAWREGTTPDALRAFLRRVGQACCEPFQESLDRLSRSVFGRPAGPAELRALYLNRMYESTAAHFSATHAVAQAQAAFRAIGFDLAHIPVDVENRPRKYPGAFCFPVAVPGDVRVSVRMASAHHLVDMLYHEFGHAAHFSGIGASLPFVERYGILSGTHECFSTLFESLLHEPEYLQWQFGLDEGVVRELLDFAHFKALLIGTWLGASALTAVEAWLDNLSWREVEARYAEHAGAFTGVPMPPGFARLEPFTAALSVYPAGYVLAEVRVAHWRQRLRELGGEAWWRSEAAQADIRNKIRAGGTLRFPQEWMLPDVFTR